MTRTLWRIAGEKRGVYGADDLSGKGAEISGGRWNHQGVGMVYAASSLALACLETLVHYNVQGLPLTRYVVEITIPEAVWQAAQTETPDSVPAGWDDRPASIASKDFGSQWVQDNRALLLIVPSVIIPEEQNVLINPRHPDLAKIKAVAVRKWQYDTRLLK